MGPWLASNAIRVVTVLLIALLIAGVLVARSCSSAQVARTETKLAAGHDDAVTDSAIDAIGTAGNRAVEERTAQTTVKENEHAIDNAPDTAGITGAGVDGLHRLGRGRADPAANAVQPARPR